MLSRLNVLRGSLHLFFSSEESELADVICGEIWCNEISFLTEISQILNTLSKFVQGRNENVLTCTDKINPFETNPESKIENKVVKFELTNVADDKNLLAFTTQFIFLLSKNIYKCFPFT
jgi:hypothetical protein